MRPGYGDSWKGVVVSIHASVKDATRFDVNVRYDALFQSTHL